MLVDLCVVGKVHLNLIEMLFLLLFNGGAHTVFCLSITTDILGTPALEHEEQSQLNALLIHISKAFQHMVSLMLG